jgi:transposase
MTKRKRFSARFKAKVTLEALKERQTLNELSSKFGVHTNQISQWKKQAITDLESLFSASREKKEKEHQYLESELYRQIGQLKVEIDWLKKKQSIYT